MRWLRINDKATFNYDVFVNGPALLMGTGGERTW